MIDIAETKKGFMRLLVRATPENRRAVINLLPAAKKAIDSGYVPSVTRSPLRSWRCLLTLLAQVAAMQTPPELIMRVGNDLLGIADRMVAPPDAIRQGAAILTKALHADLYVCRMRDAQGNWRATFADCPDGSAIPMLATILEEGLLRHPVMRAVRESREAMYIVSNDLHAIEQGGDSVDCMGYRQGYRSRLTFILREGKQDTPFGLVMLYSRQEFGFEQFEELFLGRCARFFNLAVGRRIALARDALEKAAGAMAHYGNNALNTMRMQAEFCGELMDGANDDEAEAKRLSAKLASALASSPDSEAARMASEIVSLLDKSKASRGELAGLLDGILDGIRRMSRIISSLKKSADRPRLLKYVRGVDVLRLDDGRYVQEEE